MSPARFSAVLCAVRMIGAHIATIRASNPVLAAEMEDHLAAMERHARAADDDLSAMRNEALADAVALPEPGAHPLLTRPVVAFAVIPGGAR